MSAAQGVSKRNRNVWLSSFRGAKLNERYGESV